MFASPSAAAACVLGRNSNGRLEWKVEGTKTSFGAWQESRRAEVMGRRSAPIDGCCVTVLVAAAI